MEIEYKMDMVPSTEEIIELYNASGLKRPTENKSRIEKMYANSNLVVTAWHENKLVGIARSLTDYCYCCYMSDLAVNKAHQKAGIGKKLIELTKNTIGPETMLLLVSAPEAMAYYPKVGFIKVDNGFIIKRSK